MAYRKINSSQEDVIQKVIQLGAEYGSSHVTMRTLADACQVSTFTIISMFKNKQAYLDLAAQSIDVPHMETTKRLIQSGLGQIEVFDKLLDMFLSKPDEALFYISYTYDYGFDPTSNNKRKETFLSIAKAFFSDKKDAEDDYLLLLWDYVTSMLFYYAEKIIHGYLKNDAKTRKWIDEIVFKGIL
ncbi:MAG: hypothetical protein LKE52_00170 [Bacilli bacterium]|jgi:AcrR family transcriptional regulator|nr:hypothetical protein [Bacilli bacterium]